MSELDRRAADLGIVIQDILKQFQSVHTAICTGPHVDLSHQEMRLIELLGDSGPQMMRAVAEHLGVAVNSVTNTVDNLERRELITRIRSEEDRRVIRVDLTETGRIAFQSAVEAKSQFHRAILSVLTDDEQEILLVLFRKIARAGWSQVAKLAPSA